MFDHPIFSFYPSNIACIMSGYLFLIFVSIGIDLKAEGWNRHFESTIFNKFFSFTNHFLSYLPPPPENPPSKPQEQPLHELLH